MHSIVRRMRIFLTKRFHTFFAPRAIRHVATITVLSELGRSWSLWRRNLDLGLHLNLPGFNKVISPISLGGIGLMKRYASAIGCAVNRLVNGAMFEVIVSVAVNKFIQFIVNNNTIVFCSFALLIYRVRLMAVGCGFSFCPLASHCPRLRRSCGHFCN